MRLLAVLALTVLIAAPAYAQTENAVVGSLLAVEGTVSLATPDAEPQPLKLNDPIHMNDVIETGTGARAFILLIDNTELTLGENAQLTVDDYVFDDGNSAANKGRYSILRGAFLYTSGLIAKKDNPDVTVNTPYGAIGIRGTTFWGGEIDDEYGILVTEGRVSVENGRGRLFIGKGQGTSLTSKTSIPTRAAAWPAEKIDRAVQTIALNEAEAVRERVGQQEEFQKDARQKLKEFQVERQNNQENLPNTPTKRIDIAPRPPAEKKEAAPQRPAPKADTVKPAENKELLEKPFKEETKKTSDSALEPLLKAPATNQEPPKTDETKTQEPAKPVQQPVRQRPLIQDNGTKADSAL